MKRPVPPDSPLLFDDPVQSFGPPDLFFERDAARSGLFPVAGTDEAGRGPLAGPVVAAAVILDWDSVPEGLNDSKQLSVEKRESLFDQILKSAWCCIASSSAATIDATDIRKASLDAMRRAVLGLELQPKFVLVDGRDVPKGLPCMGKALVKGDARSLSIAAASILAKVARDRMMERAAVQYPGYGFEQHAGYGTAQHRAAITKLGPCPLHRMSFRPLRQE